MSSLPASVRRRRFPQLPLHVEEDHHHVLTHILSAVGGKRMELTGNALIHFDSHPDLLLPRTLTAADAADKKALLSAVSIENWILPCVALGLFDRIAWVRPPWAGQIPPGVHRFHVGRHRDTGHLRLTCPESYFVGEGLLCRRSELEDEKELTLLVVRVDDPDAARKINDLLGVDTADEDLSVVVDVDLDFFSTRNPFLSLYPESGLYDRLRALYKFDPVPAALAEDPEARLTFALSSGAKRATLLDELEDLFGHMDRHSGDLSGYSGVGAKHLLAVAEIKDAIESHYEEAVDWMTIHDAGCTCDDTELPHHVSDAEEIAHLGERVRTLLSELRCQTPRLLTVARSTLDDFCPAEQVEEVQAMTVAMLTERYRDVEVHWGYKDE